MTQIQFRSLATTVVVDGVATTAFPIPIWAPDIRAFGATTAENRRGTTWGAGDHGFISATTTVKYVKAGTRAFQVDGARGKKGTNWPFIMHYEAVGDLTRV